jgi:N-acetylglucosamine kinase-like BadF-type ATPase
MSQPSLLLGIDGGGTKTECWLARCRSNSADPELMGKGRAGPSNPRAVGLDAASAAIDAAVAAAFREAGCERSRAAACVIGLAGAAREQIRAAITAWAAQRELAATVDVVRDVELPLAAAAPDGAGIALISGTGSVAFGRNLRGETARVGGWGYLLGDLGSAYAIGRVGIEEACRAADGCRMPTLLTQKIPQYFGVDSMRDVADLIYASPDPRQTIARVAPVVFAASELGDVLSQKSLDAARSVLVDMVCVLAEELELAGQPFTLALAGSVLINEPSFAQGIVAGVADICNTPLRPVLVPEPAIGAVQMALRRSRR